MKPLKTAYWHASPGTALATPGCLQARRGPAGQAQRLSKAQGGGGGGEEGSSERANSNGTW